MGDYVQVELLWPDLFGEPVNYEVAVHFANSHVFGAKQRKTRQLTERVTQWLEQHGGDWGMVNWYREEIYRGEFEPMPGMVRVGSIFQFGDRRTAQLFLLRWNSSGRARDTSRRPIEEEAYS